LLLTFLREGSWEAWKSPKEKKSTFIQEKSGQGFWKGFWDKESKKIYRSDKKPSWNKGKKKPTVGETTWTVRSVRFILPVPSTLQDPFGSSMAGVAGVPENKT